MHLSFCDPMDCNPPGSSVYGISESGLVGYSKNTGVGCHFLLPGDLPNPGIEPACISCIAGGFFITEPPGKPCISSMANPISHYEIEIKQITHIVASTALAGGFLTTSTTWKSFILCQNIVCRDLDHLDIPQNSTLVYLDQWHGVHQSIRRAMRWLARRRPL